MRPHSGATLPFVGIQEWIFTPHGLVGCSTLCLTGKGPWTACGLGGMIRFEGAGEVSLVNGSGSKLQLGRYGKSTYAMVANIRDTITGILWIPLLMAVSGPRNCSIRRN